MSENTAKISAGSYIKEKYYDLVYPKPKDNRTGAEIAAGVIRKAGLKIVKKNGGEENRLI
ncbi:MAG: hypothetical protein NC320_09095 [Clostridium sp.]|nr:hypothetical protein [Clostridium sp.]MCM1547917.1 hypothetical protein [Ruminococcus sp.]